LQQAPAMIKNSSLRRTVAAILDNPYPTFTTGSKFIPANIKSNLVKAGYLAVSETPGFADPVGSIQPFYSAPGSGYQGHHSCPGGLALHTALNLESSLGLFEGYRRIDDTVVDRDVVIASQLLHDQQKPWVFQWLSDGSSRKEVSIASAGEHHIYSIAESIYRGLPAEVCVAQACAHDYPGTVADLKNDKAVHYLKAACILLDVKPEDKGVLTPDGTLPQPPRIENFICHLGDHDWVLSGAVATEMIKQMQLIARDYYKIPIANPTTAAFNSFRNYLFSQVSILQWYMIYSTEGYDEVAALARQLVARP
jgi:hypothetical protein